MAAYQLGHTQRGRIRDLLRNNQEEPEITVGTDYIELQEEKSTGDNTGPESRQSYCAKCDLSLIRCIFLGVLVAAAIVGTIIGVTIYAETHKQDSNSNRGIITSEIVEPNECHDNKPALGQHIAINCSIDRKTWPYDTLPERIEAVHRNPALNVSARCKPSGRNVTCLLPGVARCSSRRRYDIKFYDSTDTKARVSFIKSVDVQIKANTTDPQSQIRQEYLDSINTSMFCLSCQYDGDCERYQMRFFGNGYILADKLQCNSSHSDTNGQSIRCSANVSKEIILQHGNGTNIYCQVMDGNVVHRNKTFDLPECLDYAAYLEDCKKKTTKLYTCVNETVATVKPQYGECDIIKTCYPLRYLNSPTNATKDCLGWCRNTVTSHIDTTRKRLYEPLCS